MPRLIGKTEGPGELAAPPSSGPVAQGRTVCPREPIVRSAICRGIAHYAPDINSIAAGPKQRRTNVGSWRFPTSLARKRIPLGEALRVVVVDAKCLAWLMLVKQMRPTFALKSVGPNKLQYIGGRAACSQ